MWQHDRRASSREFVKAELSICGKILWIYNQLLTSLKVLYCNTIKKNNRINKTSWSQSFIILMFIQFLPFLVFFVFFQIRVVTLFFSISFTLSFCHNITEPHNAVSTKNISKYNTWIIEICFSSYICMYEKNPYLNTTMVLTNFWYELSFLVRKEKILMKKSNNLSIVRCSIHWLTY